MPHSPYRKPPPAPIRSDEPSLALVAAFGFLIWIVVHLSAARKPKDMDVGAPPSSHVHVPLRARR